MTKNTKSVSFERKLNAIIVFIIFEVMFFSASIAGFSYHEYTLGLVFLFTGIIFILIVLSNPISKLFNEYKLRTNDYELYKVKSMIESFKQSRNWPNESGYQADLYNFLKKSFTEAKLEQRTGASRPDITIKDIAIEIKGPTTDDGINSIPAKCMKYSKYYRKIIFVLFSPKFSQANFIEIKKGVEETFHNRAVFIIKQNL